MKEKVECSHCGSLIDIIGFLDDFSSTSEEETFQVVECDECNGKNALSWKNEVHFSSEKATEEDIKEFPE